MKNLTRAQSDALWNTPDEDLSATEVAIARGRMNAIQEARQEFDLNKSAQRRRSVPNVFATFKGHGQPRQGFLSPEIMRAVYLRSEVVRACVDTLVELVCGVNWAIRAKDEEHARWLRSRKPSEYQDQKRRIEWLEKFFRRPNPYERLGQFHRKILKDLLIYDALAYEIVSTDYQGRRLPLELGAIAAETIEIETDDAGNPVRYWQSYNVLRETEFEHHEIAYAMLNPCTWSPYGNSPIETAYVSIASDLNANRYNAAYFEKNGIPPALLAVMGLGSAEFRKLMQDLRQTSNDNPWNLHAFRAQRNPDGTDQKIFELIPFTQVSNKDMQFTELLTHVVRRITMLYRITPSQIGFTDEVTGGIGSGVAETQVDLMESKGVAPLLSELEQIHTEKVIQGVCGWDDLEFAFIQSQTPKELQERADDAQEVTSSIMTINEFRSKWGGRDAVDWGDLPLSPPQGWQPPMSPQQMQQQLTMAQQGMGGDPGLPPVENGQPVPPQQQEEGQAEPAQPEMQKSAGDRRIIVRW